MKRLSPIIPATRRNVTTNMELISSSMSLRVYTITISTLSSVQYDHMKGTTYSIRIAINKAHSKNHDHSTINLSEIFIVRLSRCSFSAKHNPEADRIWYKKYTIDDKKAYDISDELPNDGYEWTNGTKCTGVLEYSHPDKNYSRAQTVV